MSEAMDAEFDTVAAWTAEVAAELGPDYYLPAGCRGSGSPGALRWFLDQLAITSKDRMLDCGAGVGGPGAFARAEVGVVPVLSDLEAGACRAASQLFDLPVVQAASELPFRTDAFDVAWSLGVLCTVPDQPLLLDELRRVLVPGGRVGLLVFVAQDPPLSNQPEGNNFPTDDGLRTLLDDAGFTIVNSASLSEFAATPELWDERLVAVEDELSRRHHDDPLWQTAAHQSGIMGQLLADGELVGTMIMARVDTRST